MTRPIARLAKVLVAALAATVLLVLASAIFLASGPGERFVRRTIEQTAGARTGATVVVRELELRPWRLEARATGVSVRRADPGDEVVYALEARSARASYGLTGRLRLELDAPELTVRVRREPSDDVVRPSIGARLERARLERAAVAGGVLRLLDASGQEVLRVDGITLALEREALRRFASSASGAVRVRADAERFIEAGALTIEGEIAGDEIQMTRAHLEREGADLDGRGTLRQSPHVDGAIEADFRLAAEVVRELFPQVRATGEVDGTARLALGPEGLRIEAAFRGAGLYWDRLGPFGAGGSLRLADRRIELMDGTLEGYGGRADMSGAWDLETERQDLALAWTGVDVNGVADDLDAAQMPVVLRSSGDATLAATGFERDSVTGDAAVELEGRARRTGAPLEASAHARLEGGAVEVRDGRAVMGAGSLGIEGRIEPDGSVSAQYRLGWSDLERVDEAAAILGAPAVPIDVAGSLDARGTVGGSLQSPRWTAVVDRQQIVVEDERIAVAGAAAGDRRAARVSGLAIEAGGGHVRLDGTVSWGGVTRLAMRLDVEQVDLCALLEPALAPACGVLDAQGTFSGALADPQWALDGEVSELRSRRPEGVRSTPGLLRFRAHRDDAGGGDVVVDELRGVLDGGAIDGSGRWSPATREVEGQIRVVDLPLRSVLPANLAWSDLLGELDVDATFEGPLEMPRGEARVSVRGLEFEGRPLPDVEALVEANGGGDLEIVASAADGDPFFTARLELEAPYPIQADLLLDAIPQDAIVTLLQNLPHPVRQPMLAGRVAIDAALEPPIELHVRGEIERLQAQYGGLRLAAEPFAISGDREGLFIEELRLQADTATLLVSGTLPLGAGRELDLRATGDVPLELLETTELALDGTAQLDLVIAGRWREPRVSGMARVLDASGRFGNVDWQGVSLEARLAERHIFLEASEGRLLGGTFTARGEMTIEDPIEESDVEIVADVEGIDLVRFAPDLPARPRPYFILDGEATLTASRLDLAAVDGWVDLLSVRAGADGNQMSTLEATRVVVADGRATLPELHLVGGGTDIRVEGTTSLERPVEDVEGRVIGDVDFAQLGFLATSLPGLEIGGLGTIDLEVHTGPEGIELEGGGTIVSGRISSLNPRFVLSDIIGDVAFRGSAIRLRDLQGNLGGGIVEGRASLDLANLSRLESVVLEAEATEVNLTFGDGVRARLTGDALFQGRGDRYRLKGDLRVLSGLFTREIDAATSEREFLAGIRAELTEEETAPFAETVELGMRLATQGDVFVDNELTRVTAGGNLRIEGTLAQPELTGLITNTSEGILRLGRNVFNLELARIAFEGYPIEPPSIEVVATTEVAGHTVRLELEGTPDDVDTTLTSTDPRLTQGDLAALLTTGRTAETAPEGATALLEAQAAAYVGELFQEQLGLGLVFDTPAALPILSSETGPENRFTVGRRLTDQITIAYSVGVDDDETELWILDYQPLRRLWFRAIEEGGEAFTFEIAQRLTLDTKETRLNRSEPSRIRTIEVVPSDPGRPLPPLGKHLRVRVGQRYDYWRAEDAAEHLRLELKERGFAGAQVTIETEKLGERDVALRFLVDIGPRVGFRWIGDDPGKELRRRIERQWGSHLPPGLLVADLAATTMHELRADRYYEARVFGSVSEEDGALAVELEVRRGPRGKGVDVEFVDNQVLADAALRAVLPEADDPGFFAWIGEDPGYVEDAIALRYAEEGYLDVRIGGIATSYDQATARLRVRIPVEEGQRYTVEAISFPGREQLPESSLEAALPIRVGEVFSLTEYRLVSREARRYYRDQGFPDATARSRVRRIEPGALEIVVTVEEGAPAVIGSIEIVGHFRTREELIRRRLELASGAPLQLDELARAERQLYRLGVFRSVEVVALDPEPGTHTRNVVVRVVEKPTVSLDYGVRYRTADVENLQTTIDEAKTKGFEAVLRTHLLQPFRSGDSMTLTLFAGEERRRARLGYQIPQLFGQWVPTELSVESGRETRERSNIEVKTRSSRLIVQQRRILGQRTQLLYGPQLLRGRLDGVTGLPADTQVRTREWIDHHGLITSIVHEGRDDVMNPRSGWFASGGVSAGSELIGAETDYLRVNGQFSLFLPLGRGSRAPVWASSYRAGAIWSADPFADPLLDLEDRFTAGGPFSVRGFDANALGPRFPEEDGFPIGGRAVLIFNQELRFPLWRGLWGGVFFDAGNVFARAEDLRLGELRESAGVGLRYDLGFGVLRADVARVLDRQPGEASERFHLSFGHAF